MAIEGIKTKKCGHCGITYAANEIHVCLNDVFVSVASFNATIDALNKKIDRFANELENLKASLPEDADNETDTVPEL